jgi:hypothetical protein
MALTPAEKQRRYRDKRKAADQTTPDAIERALLQEVERCGRGELSDQERIALADRREENDLQGKPWWCSANWWRGLEFTGPLILVRRSPRVFCFVVSVKP